MQASLSRPIPGPVAVIHQALDPPLIDGARKPRKRGGYTDSGADIAFALRGAGAEVVTPEPAPDPSRDDGWTFPDTAGGIGAALAAGARVLWANTVLFSGHPLEQVSGVGIVGQRAADVHRFDDKWQARNVLRDDGLPFPAAVLAGVHDDDEVVGEGTIDDALLERAGIGPDAIVKPVRGRGSQGVSRASSALEVRDALARLFAATSPGAGGPAPLYGDRAIVEEFLPGEEITVAVLPPGAYRFRDGDRVEARHWALPVVRRTGHERGIAPYSGEVPVIRNSTVVSPQASADGEVERAVVACERAAERLGARAAVRIDCRRSRSGRMTLFDVNLKPNLTGPGRPGRDAEESLVSLAGRAAGWSYPELVLNLLGAAWTR